MICFLKSLFSKKQPKRIITAFNGVVKNKKRVKNPPKSYSLCMPQGLLNSAYKESPRDYDLFYIYINDDQISVPPWVYDAVEIGKSYRIQRTGPNLDLDFMTVLNNIE